MASGTRSQIGRIRRILNRRDPIPPENGMSSFPSALSLLKIRGISPIKIRIFDYDRFSRSSSVPSFLRSSLIPFLSFHSLSRFSLFSLSIRFHKHLPRVPMKFQKLLSAARLYFCHPLSKKKKHADLAIKLITAFENYFLTLRYDLFTTGSYTFYIICN